MRAGILLAVVGCTGSTVGTTDSASVDSGTWAPVCDGFQGAPATSTSSDPYAVPCPGGGTFEDLFTSIRVAEDALAGACEVCPAGELLAEVHIGHLCDVDIEVFAACPFDSFTLTQPDGVIVSAQADCFTTTSPIVVESEHQLLWSQTLHATTPGEYRLDVALSADLGSHTVTFCVEGP